MDLERAKAVMDKARSTPGGMAELLANEFFQDGYLSDNDHNSFEEDSENSFWWAFGRQCADA